MNRSALVLALITLLLWSCTASMMLELVGQPTSRIIALSFLIASLVGLPYWRQWKVPWRTFLLGTLSFAAYRLMVMAAFQLAPGMETNLLNGLHPLLIVVLAPAILVGYPVRPIHIIGAILGCGGAAIAVTGGHLAFHREFIPGYVLAGISAILWAIYSLLLKRVPPTSSMAVGGYLFAAGLICFAIDRIGAIWTPEPPLTLAAFLWIAALGLGPTGIAYITWDAAMKRGDPRIIGSLMYLAPLSSTALVSLITHRPLTGAIAIGAVLLTVGATVSSWDTLRTALRGAPAAA